MGGPEDLCLKLSMCLQAHTIVLAGASDYFKMCAANWQHDNPLVFRLVADGKKQAEALERMIEFVYTGKLHSNLISGVDQLDLLLLIQEAEKHLCSACVTVGMQRLASLSVGEVTWELVRAVYTMQFLEAGMFKPIMQLIEKALFKRLGDLEAAWQSDELRAQFLLLPYPAVNALLVRDDLRVASENTVLHALVSWRDAQKVTMRVRNANMADLVKRLRLVHLSPSYWSDVVPKCMIITSHIPLQQMMLAHHLSLLSMTKRNQLIHSRNETHGKQPDIDHMVKARFGKTAASRVVSVSISKEQLQRDLATVTETPTKSLNHFSKSLHYHGYIWKAYARVYSREGTPTIGLFFSVEGIENGAVWLSGMYQAGGKDIKTYEQTRKTGTYRGIHDLFEGRYWDDFVKDGILTVSLKVLTCK